MSRAQEIAAAIINEVWPELQADKIMLGVLEAAVEKHLLRPHQVMDCCGDVWEESSKGKYRCSESGTTLKWISDHYGPLTTIQGEPMPDSGEVERLKERIAEKEKFIIRQEIEHDEIMQAAIKESDRQRERIAELEKRSMELVLSSAEVRGACGKQKNRIAELEKLSAKLEKSRSEISSKFSRAETHIAELEKQLADKTESLDSLKSRHYEMSQELESLKALSPEKASLMSKIDSLEREKQADAIVISANRRDRDDMVKRIVELERQLAEAKAEQAKPTAQPEPIWQQIGEGEWVYGWPVRGVVRQRMATVLKRMTSYIWSVHAMGRNGNGVDHVTAIEAAEKAMGIS